MANVLKKKIEFKGRLILKTGLHIGGTNSNLQIGGIDKGVIRNPINNQPFIPGSSLKGKLRSLFQISTGEIKTLPNPMGGQVYNVPTDNGADAELFGNATGNSKTQKPSRIIVRDCKLLGAINPKGGTDLTVDELLNLTEMPFTEGKTEVVIDRITSAASPRQIERVPAGVIFSLNMVLNIWEQDHNEETLINNLFKSLELLKDDYLGGSGSRGYGQVAIELKEVTEKTSDGYYGKKDGKTTDLTSKYQDQINKLKS
jgi:CRISPR-associated protein Csm3